MLTNEEIEAIALYLGYRANDQSFKAVVDDITSNTTSTVRIQDILAEIIRLDGLVSAAATSAKAIKVEEIEINLGYRDTLKNYAKQEVIKLARLLHIPILVNFFDSSDIAVLGTIQNSDAIGRSCR